MPRSTSVNTDLIKPACLARIDTRALRHNYAVLKQKAQGAKVLALLKANAYGHGLLSVARALVDADAFGVARIDEAVRLREAGIKNRIVILGGVQTLDEWRVVDRLGLDVVIHQEEQLLACQDFCAGLSSDQHCGFNVWLKFDTGMHRLGFALKSLAFVKKSIDNLAQHFSQPVVVMSHFANADDINDPLNQAQAQAFKSIQQCFSSESEPDSASKNNVAYEFALANSGALLSQDKTKTSARLDWVRPGIALFGISPYPSGSAGDLGLEPVMSLESRIIASKTIEAGEGVGYGQVWHADKQTRIGIASIGYGDGYPWQAANGTPVMVNGSQCELVGRVSMDLIAIDLSNALNAATGALVQLWGDQLPVETVAAHANAISYTLVCGITQRVSVELI